MEIRKYTHIDSKNGINLIPAVSNASAFTMLKTKKEFVIIHNTALFYCIYTGQIFKLNVLPLMYQLLIFYNCSILLFLIDSRIRKLSLHFTFVYFPLFHSLLAFLFLHILRHKSLKNNLRLVLSRASFNSALYFQLRGVQYTKTGYHLSLARKSMTVFSSLKLDTVD